MSLNDQNTPDLFDEVLRDYLLENDPKGPGGEGLMEVAFEQTEGAVAPPLTRETELLSRLKKDFAAAPQPGAVTGGFSWNMAIVGSLAVAVSIVLLLVLLKDNFVTPQTELPANSAEVYVPDANDGSYANIDEIPTNPNPNVANDGANPDAELTPAAPDRKKNSANHKHNLKEPVLHTDGSGNPVNSHPSDDPNGLASVGPVAAPIDMVNPFPLKPLFRQTVVPSQFFEVDNRRGDVIYAKNGTLLHIPAFCFVNTAGLPIDGNIQIEVKEVYRPAEFLMSNLPTVSNGRQLISGGAVYIDAKSRGEKLQIASNKDVYVEFASQAESSTRDMQVFQGDYNARGEMNLVPSKGSKQYNTMTAIPIGQVDFDRYVCNCSKYWNDILWEISDEYFQNTWIATREFEERLEATRRIADEVDPIMTEIVRMYRDNTDKELWRVDQMVADMLREKQRQDGSGKDYKDEVFQKFAAQMLTFVEVFDDYGVNFEDADAYDQLIRKGVQPAEASRLLRVYDLTCEYLGDPNGGIYLGDKKKKKLSRKMKLMAETRLDKRHKTARHGYSLKKSGWASLGRVLSPGYAGDNGTSLDVRLRGEIPASKTSTYLVMSGMRSMIPAREIGGDQALFKNLPANQTAYVVTLGFDDSEPYLGIRKVNLRGNRREDVTLKRTTFEDLITQLNALN